MAEERKQTSRLWPWLGAGIVVIIVFFTARFLMRDRLPVRAVQVGHERLVDTVSTNGRVEPVVNFEFHSPIAAIVKNVYVLPGDQVRPGKLLLELDDLQARARVATSMSGVKAAQASVEAATHNGTLAERQAAAADMVRNRFQRDQAQHDLDAMTKLNATGAASGSEVAAARARLELADAALHASEESSHSRYSAAEIERAKAGLADAEANLAAAQQALSQTAIHAPVAGTVYTINTGRTEFAEEGKLLMQLADLGHERVRAYFDEPEIGRLSEGQKIQIKWDARPGREWSGHIVRTPVTVITYGTRTVGEVLVDIDGPNSDLLPDTNVTVTVTTSSEPNALSVPREALHSENGKPFVYKVENGGLVRTPVTIGTPNLTLAPILTGLKEGDWVATGTTNGLPLQEGIPIKVVVR